MDSHEMVLAGYAEAGAEDWRCPACGRRMLLRWEPEFDKLVLERGDDRVGHHGSRGGLRMGGAVAAQAPGPAAPAAGATALPEHHERWLNGHGITWHGDATT